MFKDFLNKTYNFKRFWYGFVKSVCKIFLEILSTFKPFFRLTFTRPFFPMKSKRPDQIAHSLDCNVNATKLEIVYNMVLFVINNHLKRGCVVIFVHGKEWSFCFCKEPLSQYYKIQFPIITNHI